MTKILLALSILGTGTAGFLAAHYSAANLQRDASATRESWIVQTQALAAAHSEQVQLAEHIRELKQSLRQAEAAGKQDGAWSVLETNRVGDLAPKLRERLLEELGFNWHSPEGFIVVSKQTLRDIYMWAIRQGKLAESAVAALALTPQERSQIEAAMERVRADLKDWAISHTERREPRDDVLAQYTLKSAPPMSITNHFTEAFRTVGKQRTELLTMGCWPDRVEGNIQAWMEETGLYMSDKPVTMILKRFEDADRQVVKFSDSESGPWTAILEPFKGISELKFPSQFRPLFPNGWTDVAKREGFEISKELQKQ